VGAQIPVVLWGQELLAVFLEAGGEALRGQRRLPVEKESRLAIAASN